MAMASTLPLLLVHRSTPPTPRPTAPPLLHSRRLTLPSRLASLPRDNRSRPPAQGRPPLEAPRRLLLRFRLRRRSHHRRRSWWWWSKRSNGLASPVSLVPAGS
ncbi:hypothetical protein EE612_053313 [Oryza sativa]|nr:hypothetical protein EE612_053313 [Oryza sativa]